jgi:hypothetical protein
MTTLSRLFITLSLAGTACSSPSDPFTSGAGHASVTGMIADASGSPRPAATVRIACAGGGDAVIVPTDDAGRYMSNLATGQDPFSGRGGRLKCRFTEPATGAVKVQVDTSLGFARGPVLVPLQFVDLREP